MFGCFIWAEIYRTKKRVVTKKVVSSETTCHRLEQVDGWFIARCNGGLKKIWPRCFNQGGEQFFAKSLALEFYGHPHLPDKKSVQLFRWAVADDIAADLIMQQRHLAG